MRAPKFVACVRVFSPSNFLLGFGSGVVDGAGAAIADVIAQVGDGGCRKGPLNIPAEVSLEAPPTHLNLEAHVFGGSASAKGLSNRDGSVVERPCWCLPVYPTRSGLSPRVSTLFATR